MEVWIRQSMAYHPQTDGPTPFPVPGWMWDRAAGRQLYGDRMRYIRRVDEMGFDGLICTEHHYGPNGGLTPSPVIMLAAASQVTERIKLISMGIALALYPHPVRVAEELAMIDNLCAGRLVVGFISSGAQSLYAYSLPVQEERGRYHEAYDLVTRAWTEENPFSWSGEYFNYECVSILPRPLQVPHPPIWTTASSAESIQWAASHRIGFIASGSTSQCKETLDYYRQCAEQSGWTPTEADLGIAREFFIAPTSAKVQEMMDEVFARDRANAYDERFEHPKLQELDRERFKVRTYDYRSPGNLERERGRTLQSTQSGRFLVGDPKSLTEQILEQKRQTGAGVLIIRPEMGALNLDDVADGLDLFAHEVLPVVQAASGA